MSTNQTTRMQRLLKFGALAAVAIGVLIWPAYLAIKSTAGTYQQIAPLDQAALEANRYLYSEEPSGKDEDIIAIYGLAIDTPTAYVFVDESLVLHPVEKPELVLVQRPAEGQLLQVAGLFSRMGYASLGALMAALGMLSLRWILRRRGRKAAAAV
jgi:hypothetical protein